MAARVANDPHDLAGAPAVTPGSRRAVCRHPTFRVCSTLLTQQMRDYGQDRATSDTDVTVFGVSHTLVGQAFHGICIFPVTRSCNPSIAA
jgi:hypothetical protein